MKKVLSKIAEVIKKIAEFGAGSASMGLSYEPKVPATLRK